MTMTVQALCKGKTLILDESVDWTEGRRVLVTIESEQNITAAQSSLDFLSELNLEGPSDASAKVDDYLYGGAKVRG